MLFLYYSRCGTCVKALKYLNSLNLEFKSRDIITENPSVNELKKWIKLSGLETNKFFNTSGVLYKEMQLKDKIKELSEEEKIKLLATNGKLVKRPILVLDNKVLVGFKLEEYQQLK